VATLAPAGGDTRPRAVARRRPRHINGRGALLERVDASGGFRVNPRKPHGGLFVGFSRPPVSRTEVGDDAW